MTHGPTKCSARKPRRNSKKIRKARASSTLRGWGPCRKRISSGAAAPLPHWDRSEAGGAPETGGSGAQARYSGPWADCTATTETLSGAASSRGRWLHV